MRRGRGWVIGLLLVVGAGVAGARWLVGEIDGAGQIAVQRGDFAVTVAATGKLEAAVNFEVGPPSARDFWEYNLTWMIPEGSRVKQGDVVARFDTTQLDDQLRDQRAGLETTQQEREKEQRNLEVSLKQLKLDLVKAEGELKKVDLDLSVPAGLVSDIELEQTRLRKQLAERRVAFLREKIDFERELVQSKLDLLDVKQEFWEGKIAYNEAIKEKFSVRAPTDGLVVYIPKRDGDRWEVGEGVWMLAKILKVADVSTLQVEADILEVDAARVAPGQVAEVAVDAVPGLSLSSSVAEIGEIVHERSEQDPGKVFDAILPVGEVATDLPRPGMGVHVEIRSELLADRLSIPLEAVQTSAEGTYVEVRGPAGQRQRRVVELGARNRARVVVESGLEEGEVVLLPDAATRS